MSEIVSSVVLWAIVAVFLVFFISLVIAGVLCSVMLLRWVIIEFIDDWRNR